ncbi:hypothetical protein [Paenibacillus sp. MMS20-IR301]|uniref:hypothetical protein n=1 Tax=Paenibacillus sp. MMS20-IR301 TaxID=2895946 RepID=UPI0028E5440B|nr:hypothetical protein [Paenibacillus sp. MMS20-IR301]WNS44383.1 hypothetical protein LOS79_03670 [Paenibacillus sp. MMS20-IR301]
MQETPVRVSSSAVTIVGKPEQIKGVLEGWMKQYGRDMPLSYILLLKAETRMKASKAG